MLSSLFGALGPSSMLRAFTKSIQTSKMPTNDSFNGRFMIREFPDNSQWPLNSFLVSHEKWALFMPIAKNANTSLKQMFVRLSGHDNSSEILHGNIHINLTSQPTKLSLCDYTPGEAANILSDDSYFRYVVLRDPLTRAASGYVSKFVLHPPPVGDHGEPPVVIGDAIDWVYHQRGEKPDYVRSITFEEFVIYVTEQADVNLDTHFKSQDSYLGQQSFDFVGAVEKMGRLRDVLESHYKQKIKMKHENRSMRRWSLLRRSDQHKLLPARIHSQRIRAQSSELLTHEIVERLKWRYAKDFERWQQALD